MSNKYFVVFIAVLFGLGLFLGWRLSTGVIEFVKLINVTGLSYNLLGLIVISELVVKDIKLKQICIDYIAPAVLWFQTIVPFGMAISYSTFL